MAGRGPAPKDPRDRVRHSSNYRHGPRYVIVEANPAPQPPLPATMPDGSDWPEQTRQWWTMWESNPRTVDYHLTDWAMLLDTAVLHGLYWRGDLKVAGELRLRVAKHGATTLDGARLRVLYGAL